MALRPGICQSRAWLFVVALLQRFTLRVLLDVPYRLLWTMPGLFTVCGHVFKFSNLGEILSRPMTQLCRSGGELTDVRYRPLPASRDAGGTCRCNLRHIRPRASSWTCSSPPPEVNRLAAVACYSSLAGRSKFHLIKAQLPSSVVLPKARDIRMALRPGICQSRAWFVVALIQRFTLRVLLDVPYRLLWTMPGLFTVCGHVFKFSNLGEFLSRSLVKSFHGQ